MWVPQKDFSTFFRIFKFPCKWILFGQFSFYTYWLNCSFRVKFKEVHSWIFRLNRKMVGYQSKCTYSADGPIMQREKRLDLFYNILWYTIWFYDILWYSKCTYCTDCPILQRRELDLYASKKREQFVAEGLRLYLSYALCHMFRFEIYIPIGQWY